MKITIVALIAAFCLVAANAGTISEIEPVEFEVLQYMAADHADMEISEASIWSGFYWIAKGALKTLKGMNCTIKEVISLRATCLNYLAAVQSCGADVTAQVQAVINCVNSIITLCNNILNLNSTICGNSTPANASEDFVIYSNRTGWNCFWKVLAQVLSLQKQIQNTVSAIQKLPSNTSSCVMTATDTLTSAFTNFPSNIKTCSKLTSN